MIIGTRGSKLALVQANWVRKQILAHAPDAMVTVKVIKVAADADEAPIRGGLARGVFVKEIDEALLAGGIDVAVHSLKDVPTRLREGIEIGVIPAREDARDAFVARAGVQTLQALPRGAVVGTGSLRRQAQILALRRDLRVADIRGNVDTRLQKLQDGGYDAVVLACAGLERLGLQDRITLRLPLEEMVPAPGQGALAIATRRGDTPINRLVAPLHHRPSALAVGAERAFLMRVGGGCNSPVAVHAALDRGVVRIEGLVAAPDGSTVIREAVAQAPHAAEEAATSLADRILARGGRAILQALR